ncbi:MAG: hypothetical protein KIB43_09640 [Clostridium baratii]|uniref:hypothetical protein n=1 Tax=Clostridium baratii TaxID=1561 RepID=UPI0006C11EFF|nr:hypothetical protein [Clostridium baratii]MBS6007208.1 hypothetical protein [Clostridium baratii]MDU4911090.1 hypothetical protein [Clostridium baratii]CUP48589.1 Uncharacterised protein [Clostridium baratii]
MNQGQEKFLSFIMQNVEEKNQDKAKELLNESFAKQDNGTFNAEYMAEFIPRMLELIKPGSVEQVKNIMMNHKA